jgi:hypothetical protein
VFGSDLFCFNTFTIISLEFSIVSLYSWMGKDCGQKEIPFHYDLPMQIID